ncbi:protein KASH5 [Pelobates fuscus]|uniref:protein KASH5 n=1 Tax=Pelobates fuscus TaxID=191477 RepID=UPI002FE46F5C
MDNCPEDLLVHIVNSSPEEQMLDSAFRACDSEGIGKVSVSQIIEYLKRVTDPNCDGERLQSLCNMLDPENEENLIDWDTFRTVMTNWIASCCQEMELCGTKNEETLVKDNCHPSTEKVHVDDAQQEAHGWNFQKSMVENVDLISKIRELDFANKKLIEQKAKLQMSLELADETSSQLTEEISDLKNKLKRKWRRCH